MYMMVLYDALRLTSLQRARGFFFASFLRRDGKVEEGKAWTGMSRPR